VLAGDGLLTRVEGEWWLRFTGEALDKNQARAPFKLSTLKTVARFF
jgi:hypothetical protein